MGDADRAEDGSPDVASVIAAALEERELSYERPESGRFVVTLPGTKKLQTICWLIIGAHALRVEAFVCRQPDENREQLWSYLLQHNSRMYGVAYSIDSVGDIYLVGRLGLHAVTAEEIDRLLGSVLTYADEHFNTMLEIGFGSSIRREWDWRISRGESLANLAAFAEFAQRRDRDAGTDAAATDS
ncbi:MAG: YbjN domain-containing protein [Geodermatophilaceae bacterium]|nr:YbjN domain-containing protein [Geodermatophilaceae bacterium]